MAVVIDPSLVSCQFVSVSIYRAIFPPVDWYSIYTNHRTLLTYSHYCMVVHPRRWNVTTLMVGLKNGHIRKNLTQKW